jgi:hypothetical protein
MNGRERFFAALEGRPSARTAIWLLFPYFRVNHYADVRNLPCYRTVWEAALKYAPAGAC